jgi:hypothetical protein
LPESRVHAQPQDRQAAWEDHISAQNYMTTPLFFHITHSIGLFVYFLLLEIPNPIITTKKRHNGASKYSYSI